MQLDSTFTTSDLTSQRLHHDELRQMQVISLPIPCFQKLAQITGDLTAIAATIKSLKPSESIWLEVIYDADEIVNELREEVNAMIEGLTCEVLKIKNTRTYNKVLNQRFFIGV
jgi:DNA repair protein SbcD/Mre11